LLEALCVTLCPPLEIIIALHFSHAKAGNDLVGPGICRPFYYLLLLVGQPMDAFFPVDL
jgi:hypothetical protein